MRAPWPGRRLGLRTGNVYLGTPDRWETITETTVHEGLNGKEASTTRRRVFVPGRDGADHPDSMTFRQPADLDVFLRFLPVVGTVMSIAEGDLEGAILGLAGDFLWGLGALAKAGRAANLARGAHAAENVADVAPALRSGTRLPLNLVDDGARTVAPGIASHAHPFGPGIGRSGFRTTADFSEEVFVRYQRYIDDAYSAYHPLVADGLLRPPPGVSVNTYLGQLIDSAARNELRAWLRAEGLTEGRRGIIQVNRRLLNPSGGRSYRIPDIRIPGANIIYDGTIWPKPIGLPQIVDFHAFSGGNNIVIVRPTRLGGAGRPICICIPIRRATWVGSIDWES